MRGAIPPFLNTPSWRSAQLRREHRDNFSYLLQGLLVSDRLRRKTLERKGFFVS